MASAVSSDRRRSLLMQLALCVVLALSLAAAALVSRRQIRTHRVSLGTTSTIDGLIVQRPDDWKLVREDDGLLLQEAGKAIGAPRKLKIRYVRSSIFMSP